MKMTAAKSTLKSLKACQSFHTETHLPSPNLEWYLLPSVACSFCQNQAKFVLHPTALTEPNPVVLAAC